MHVRKRVRILCTMFVLKITFFYWNSLNRTDAQYDYNVQRARFAKTCYSKFCNKKFIVKRKHCLFFY